MLASELIAELQALLEREGKDLPVKLDTNPHALVGIDYVDIDCEEDTIVISALSIEETTELDEAEEDNGR